MHPAQNTHLVQSHIDDLYRSVAGQAHRAEVRRANARQRAAQRPQAAMLPQPSMMRRLAARLAH